MSRAGYEVVDRFEQELAAYCDARFAVATDCCSNAIMLSLAWWRLQNHATTIRLPRNTYVGVPIAAWNAGHDVEFIDVPNWQIDREWWPLTPTSVIDAARVLHRGIYTTTLFPSLLCLSFSVEKHLEIGKGGAILTGDEDARDWFIRARHDGRTPGDPTAPIQWPAWHCNLPPDYAARGLWLLDHLPDRPEPLEPTDYPDLEAICSSAAIIARNSVADSRGAESLA